MQADESLLLDVGVNLCGAEGGKGVYNMEQNDPDPFMEELNKYGLPWQYIELSEEDATALRVSTEA